MTDGATSVTCLDETINHKSSLSPDESIELPALRNPLDAPEKQQDKVIKIVHLVFEMNIFIGFFCFENHFNFFFHSNPQSFLFSLRVECVIIIEKYF